VKIYNGFWKKNLKLNLSMGKFMEKLEETDFQRTPLSKLQLEAVLSFNLTQFKRKPVHKNNAT
jgi:hypothetical protein